MIMGFNGEKTAVIRVIPTPYIYYGLVIYID
jgi:hypothetical protein